MRPVFYLRAELFMPAFVRTITLLMICLFSFVSLRAQSYQFDCGYEEVPDSTLASGSGGAGPCYDRDFVCGEDYIPFYQDFSAYDIVTVRLNFHFISTGQNNPGFGPVDGNCPTCTDNENMDGYRVAQEIVDRLNHRATNLWEYRYRVYTSPAAFTWEPFTDNNGVPVATPPDIRLRFELYDPDSIGAVHFHHFNDYNYKVLPARFEHPDSCNTGQTQLPFPDSLMPYRETALNVLFYDEYYPREFFNDNSKCRTVVAHSGNPVPMGNFWHYWKVNTDTTYTPIEGETMDAVHVYTHNLLHEVGHNLGLPHTFEGNVVCDANEVGRCTNRWDCSTNVMGYNAAQSSFSPGQVDIMLNSAYHNKLPYTFFERLSLFLCEKEAGLDELNTGTTIVWNDEDRTITKDLVIRSGTKLHIEDICVSVSREVRIYVERGAELRIDNATLQTGCTRVMAPDNDETVFSRKWGGIRVAGNPGVDHPDDFTAALAADDPGRVILLPGTVIRDAVIGVSDDWHLPVYDPTRLGGYVYANHMTFENCSKAAELMRRGSKVSKSRFHTVTVDGYRYRNLPGNNRLRDSSAITGSAGISVWATRGVEIQNCTFRNLSRYGVNTIDGSFTIAAGNNFNNIAGVGVEALASRPLFVTSPVVIAGNSFSAVNRFRNNALGIRVAGYGNIENVIEYNEFRSALEREEKGIEITGSRIVVDKNRFEKIFNGTGIHDMGDLQNQAVNNQFEDFSTGILYHNGRNTEGQFACNSFVMNRFAGVNVAHPLFPDQGNATFSNANLWSRSTNPVAAVDIKVFRSNNDIGDPLGSVFDDDLFSATAPVLSYFVQNMESAGSIRRPQCNGSVPPCLGLAQNENYLTDHAQFNQNCDLPFTPVNPFEEESIPWHNDRIDSLETAGLDSTNFRLYTRLKASKFGKISELVYHYVSEEDFEAAEELLEREEDFAYRWLAFGIKVEQADYQQAEDILDDLLIGNIHPAIEEFVYVQKENLLWQEDPAYIADSTVQAALRVIAVQPTIPGATAKALLSFWNEEVFAPYIDYPDTTAPPLKREQTESMAGQTDHSPFLLYPNPGPGRFTLTLTGEGSFSSEVEITLYQLNGAQIHHREYAVSGEKSVTLDYRTQPAGMYILRVRSGSRMQYLKMMIQ